MLGTPMHAGPGFINPIDGSTSPQAGCTLSNAGGYPVAPEGSQVAMSWGHPDLQRIYFKVTRLNDERCSIYDLTRTPTTAPTVAPHPPTGSPTTGPTRWFEHNEHRANVSELQIAVVTLQSENNQLRR